MPLGLSRGQLLPRLNVLSREPECEDPGDGMSYLYRATFALQTLAALSYQGSVQAGDRVGHSSRCRLCLPLASARHPGTQGLHSEGGQPGHN